MGDGETSNEFFSHNTFKEILLACLTYKKNFFSSQLNATFLYLTSKFASFCFPNSQFSRIYSLIKMQWNTILPVWVETLLYTLSTVLVELDVLWKKFIINLLFNHEL